MTEEKKTTKTKISGKYVEMIGRRKTAVARVRLIPGGSGMAVNDQAMEKYFPLKKMHSVLMSPFKTASFEEKVGVSVVVKGGGVMAQVEAVRHGISRVLVKMDEGLRGRLKKAGFLTRDARKVER